MFNITWCTCSAGELAWGFLTEVKTGLISKSFSKGVKYRLNSDPLSNTTLCGHRYLHIHMFLKTWITLTYYLSMYYSLPSATSSRSNVGISTILNQTVARSVIFIQVRLSLFRMKFTPVCCCLIDFLYGPIRSTCTESHGFSSAIFLGGRCP